ncbi:zinc finger protein 385B isoform X2 [Electrophorus electricus]|nr:zinc finger protein 385B isoform X2 [Electrophorus electricus]XP_035376020.1 zinc finger protein 385B isoform X2 [Electrophorus electricus]
MKTPLSPAQLMEDDPPACYPPPACAELEEVAGGPGDACGPRRLLYSLCEVCNIQLNSAAQAQIHYNGKSHLRRVKQLNHAEGSPAGAGVPPPPHALGGSTGSSGHNTSLPSLVRTPPLMMQSSLDMKPFMPFPVDSSTPVGLFANFSTMDPVQKAVINHTFGVSIPPKKKQVISCNICQLRFNSDSQAEAHYKGSKHAKKLKAQETTKPRGGPALDATAQPISTVPAPSGTVTDSSSDQSEKSVEPSAALSASAPPRPFTSATAAPPNPPPMSVLSNPPLASSGQPVEAAGQAPSLRSAPKPAGRAEPGQESEEEKAKKLLYCSLCKVAVNSLSQLEAHNTGSKHKTMLEARNGAGPIKAYPRPGSKLKMQANILKGSGLQNKTFHCEICDVHVNSEIQLKQHISSRRHKDRVAGKPLKPKYSPYNKQHRGSISLAKLAFQKDLMKPISPSFLSTPFSPTTMPSISLHPRPNASIFQTATLPASFLRAAPGPIRPSTGSILFAPY